MDINKYKQLIRDVTQLEHDSKVKIDAIEHEIQQMLNEWAVSNCPIKKGDIIDVYNRRTKQNEKGIVEGIAGRGQCRNYVDEREFYFTIHCEIYGHLLKKNGDISLVAFEKTLSDIEIPIEDLNPHSMISEEYLKSKGIA